VLAGLPAGVRVSEVAFLTQLSVRLDPAAPEAGRVKDALGTALPASPCASSVVGDLAVLWLGPDEWLVVAPTHRTDLESAVRSAIAGAGAVVDVSAQRTALRVTGSRARDLLAHGCAIDLDPRTSPAGTVVQTMLALAPVAIVVQDHGFLLLVRSSFARYLADWIVDACEEYRDDPSWS
jgi:sarcosine oxidase subunit gamma